MRTEKTLIGTRGDCEVPLACVGLIDTKSKGICCHSIFVCLNRKDYKPEVLLDAATQIKKAIPV